MSKDLFRQRQLCAHQEGGPINGVKTDNILADDMKDITAFTPEVQVIRGVFGITKTSQIIGERIDPYINDIDRKSVVQGKSVSVREDLGGRRIIKKKKKKK